VAVRGKAVGQIADRDENGLSTHAALLMGGCGRSVQWGREDNHPPYGGAMHANRALSRQESAL
jgi:hypothetical protein